MTAQRRSRCRSPPALARGRGTGRTALLSWDRSERRYACYVFRDLITLRTPTRGQVVACVVFSSDIPQQNRFVLESAPTIHRKSHNIAVSALNIAVSVNIAVFCSTITSRHVFHSKRSDSAPNCLSWAPTGTPSRHRDASFSGGLIFF